jgi:hypothetical protein
MTMVGNAKGAEKRGGRKDKDRLVSSATAGVQGHRHNSNLPPWIPDHVRDDDGGERKGRGETQRARRQRQARLSREGGSPGPQAQFEPAALDPGSRPG